MGEEESDPAASKKRVTRRQLTKDNPEHDDDGPEPEMGTCKKASEEVMATRRIVKVRCNQPSTADSSNPYAGIHLVPPRGSTATAINPTDQPLTGSDTTALKRIYSDETTLATNESKETEAKALANDGEGTEENGGKLDVVTDATDDKDDSYTTEEKTLHVEMSEEDKDSEKTNTAAREETVAKDQEETEKEAGDVAEKVVKEESEKEKQEVDQKDETACFSSFQQLSSNQNAFTGFTGTGFSTSSFSFASFAIRGSTFGASSGSFFGSSSSFGAGSIVNGSSSTLISTTKDASQGGKLSLQEVPVETGEENERAVFTADATLYEYLDGGWKERGKGELKLNVSVLDSEKARLVMRSRGNFRLIMNACLYPEMSLTNMDKRGITFACVNSCGDVKDGLATFALKFKDSNTVEVFRELVMSHKDKKSLPETPENLPKGTF